MIVIGGSIGSLAALRTVIRPLPRNFPLPVAVVLHRHRDSDDALVSLLQRDTELHVREVTDKDLIQAGHLYLGPSDYHLLVEPMYFSLSTDAPVQFARPSIDVLFQSAADSLGSRAIAVVLTGGNRDGAEGAREIHRRGGTVLVQEPATSESAVMPLAALDAVPGALARPVEDMGRLLLEMASHFPPFSHP